MAGLAALQGAMAALSVSVPAAASTSSFWGNRLATYSAPQPGAGSFLLPNSVLFCCYDGLLIAVEV
uniref:Uncharacterized protein n=1 Tax=Zea mays TaxID=4577 RepID=B6TJP7_MAIZE|nr:hypothetical protein [Zea mays]